MQNKTVRAKSARTLQELTHAPHPIAMEMADIGAVHSSVSVGLSVGDVLTAPRALLRQPVVLFHYFLKAVVRHSEERVSVGAGHRLRSDEHIDDRLFGCLD